MRNSVTCPHNLVNYDNKTEELYCEECGDTMPEPDPDKEYDEYKDDLDNARQ